MTERSPTSALNSIRLFAYQELVDCVLVHVPVAELQEVSHTRHVVTDLARIVGRACSALIASLALLIVLICTVPVTSAARAPGVGVASTRCPGLDDIQSPSGNPSTGVGMFEVRAIKTRSVSCSTATSVLSNLLRNYNLGDRLGGYGVYGPATRVDGFACRKQKYAVHAALIRCQLGSKLITARAAAP